jgi:hypothetical protein
MLDSATETFFKATRPDGTSFHDGTTRWEVGKVTHLPDGPGLPYLSVSVVVTDCTGMKWPCRLFRVEPVEGHEVTTPEARVLPNKRGSSAWRVVEELDARQVLGPNADAVLAIIERARTLTDDEAWKMVPTRDAAWVTASAAAWDAAFAARSAAWDAARDAARYAAFAAWDALLATIVRDLITPEQYETLMGPWWAGVGR